MFNFFSKKKFLVDELEGFIDIHNHILPGIDDGAKTVEDSIELIKAFGEFGVKDFVATPHIMHNYYPNTPKTIGSSLSSLKGALIKNNITDVSIEAAAEHMIDDNFETILENGKVMPLKDNYLLVEMSYLQPSINFDTAIEKITTSKFYPIFAHPERYMYLHNDLGKYYSYKEKGMLLQMNLLSLGSSYGKEVQKIAYKLLEKKLINFTASDIHNINQLNDLKKITISRKTLELVLPVLNNTIANLY